MFSRFLKGAVNEVDTGAPGMLGYSQTSKPAISVASGAIPSSHSSQRILIT
jgi:hypothetical protein